MNRFAYSISAVIAFATMSGIASTPAVAQASVSHIYAFEIGAGPLGAAVARLGRQAGVVIVADPALLRGRQTSGIHGRYTAADALNRLLAGTRLSARLDNDGGYTLVDPANVADSDDDRPSGSEITVVASRAVTATKTDTKLVDTPQSISVVTSSQIAARGAIGVQEALRYTPGVRTESNGVDNRFDYVTARGGFPAAQFVDGMKRPDIGSAPRTDVYNLERVETLRGPSSVLYGQGAAGGIFNTITKRPGFTTAGDVAVQYGSFDRKQAQFDITGALDADRTIAARLVGLVRDADNQVDYGKDDRVLIAPSFRFRPNDDTDITLLGLYQKDKAAAASSYLPVVATISAPPGRPRLSRSTFLGEPSHDYYNIEEKSATLLVAHRFSDAFRYSGSVRYSRYKADTGDLFLSVWSGMENPFIDPDNRILNRERYDYRARVRMVTADNNLGFDVETGPISHKILVGIDYLRSSSRTAYAYEAGGPIDIYAPVYTGVAAAPFYDNPKEIASQLGIYVQDQISYADRVTLVLGARRDRAKTVLVATDRQVDEATTFRVGLIGKLDGGLSPYLSYSESFQPTLGLDFFGDRYLPQRGIQYEAGLKWQPNRSVLASVAFFQVKGTNRQQTDPTNINNLIQQGEVKSKGIELEGTWTVADDFSITASYAYVDAELSKAPNPIEVGVPIQAVAKHSASIWGEKRIDLGNELALRIGAGVRYTGPSIETAVFYDVDPAGELVQQRTPGYTLADAMIGLDWGPWSLSVNATNLFDTYYYGSCSVRSACGIGYARNVIGTLGYRF